MDNLKPLIDQAVDIIKGSKEFVLAQAPDFVRQYLMMKIVDAVGWTILSVFVCFVIFKAEKKLRQACIDSEWETPAILIYLPISGIGLAGIYGVLSNLCDMVAIWLAPKAWLIQSLIQLSHKQ